MEDWLKYQVPSLNIVKTPKFMCMVLFKVLGCCYRLVRPSYLLR